MQPKKSLNFLVCLNILPCSIHLKLSHGQTACNRIRRRVTRPLIRIQACRRHYYGRDKGMLLIYYKRLHNYFFNYFCRVLGKHWSVIFISSMTGMYSKAALCKNQALDSAISIEPGKPPCILRGI